MAEGHVALFQTGPENIVSRYYRFLGQALTILNLEKVSLSSTSLLEALKVEKPVWKVVRSTNPFGCKNHESFG